MKNKKITIIRNMVNPITGMKKNLVLIIKENKNMMLRIEKIAKKEDRNIKNKKK